MLEVSTHRATEAVRVFQPTPAQGWSELLLALPEFVLIDAYIDDVGELKDDAHDDALNVSDCQVNGNNQPHGINERRHDKGKGEEKRLAKKEDKRLEPLGPGNCVVAYLALRVTDEIIQQLPLYGDESIEKPEVNVLKPVKPVAGMFRAETAKNAKLDIVIMTRDIGVGVVKLIMFVIPHIGGAANEVQDDGGGFVKGFVAGKRAVIAIVHDVESGGCHGQGQGNDGDDHAPQWNRQENQNAVGGDDPEQDNADFQIHAPVAVLGQVILFKVLIHALAEDFLKLHGVAEFDFRGS